MYGYHPRSVFYIRQNKRLVIYYLKHGRTHDYGDFYETYARTHTVITYRITYRNSSGRRSFGPLYPDLFLHILMFACMARKAGFRVIFKGISCPELF